MANTAPEKQKAGSKEQEVKILGHRKEREKQVEESRRSNM